ncbi:Crp/Fnr family transcriptional regulator [Candidatus Saccharibacteria bacterium]|nr:Crp/Fnr family transcriptional regulator [Candidatus Saccharibacteria bacterium]
MVRADENPPGVFYLASGTVRQYDITEQGTVIIVNIFKPPAFFPMSWAINQTENSYFFEAMEPVELWLAPREDMVNFTRDNPDVAFNLLSRLYRGTDGLLLKMAHLMGASARSRLMLELIIAAKRFGKPSPKGEIKLNITAGELAAQTGLTRETVSRELQKLKAEKLVRVSFGIIVISNLTALEEAHGLGVQGAI